MSQILKNSVKLLCGLLLVNRLASVVFAEDSWIPQGAIGPSGIGPMRFGMSVKEASRALNVPLIEVPLIEKQKKAVGGPNCVILLPNGSPSPIFFTSADSKIVRLDVVAPGVKTESGLEVGVSADAVIRRWGRRVLRQPRSDMASPEILLLKPLGKYDKKYLVAFETDGRRVVSFRAGLLPYMQSPSACEGKIPPSAANDGEFSQEILVETKPLGDFETPESLP